ncbi:hypothetical protein F5878DRAFT_663056 [Lentinula raphanica]|uniref:Uncharacterized protein n=1 Tax=Lentinula raphanica TaxID=153919 RepID=A0AA38UBC2_9AGAR|nr:hypothetical protein F5878DRAFT_663056 [Lentinula raphanica]
MDAHYDAEKAVKALEERREVEMENAKNMHVSRLTKTEGWEDFVQIMRVDKPASWRMVKNAIAGQVEDQMVEEYQIHIQGILEDKRLPPIRGENNKSQKKMQHMRQSIVLGGFGSAVFKEDVENVLDVVALFARHVPGIQQTGIRQEGDRTVIEVANRMFTPRHEAPAMKAAKVNKLMDENGFIEQVNQSDMGFVYGEENVVHYGEEKTEPDGTRRVIDISPQKMHIGDIVDVGFSVVAIGKGRDAKARLVLRNITLLDAKHTQAWLKAKAKNLLRVGSARGTVTLKRRLDFEEQEESARGKMTRMALEDE